MLPDRIVWMRILSVVVFVAIASFIWIPFLERNSKSTQHLMVHFLDVGQGDATFIETSEHIQVLIDGGRDSSILRQLGDVMHISDRYIDIVVATHPDSDHIGGLTDVLERYDVGMIIMTENEGESDAAAAYVTAASSEGAELVYARRGQILSLGASTTIEILFPDIDPAGMESNASSIVLKLLYGQSSFLLTGDSPKSIEEYLVLVEGEHLKSNVLKVGHHGSRTSTSELFLTEVSPDYAVISAGKNNHYGHPHVEVTDALFNAHTETFSTAQEGSITFLSDGIEVWLE